MDKKDKNGKGAVPRSQLAPESHAHGLPIVVQDTERVGLLNDSEHPPYGSSGEYAEYSRALIPIVDQPDIRVSPSLLPAQRLIKTPYNWMSAPLIGAILALIFGIIPPLHHAFLDKDGVFYSSVTRSVGNIGDLFVVLHIVIVGAEALVPHTNPGAVASAFALFIRFVIMSTLSLFFVWTTAGRGWYIDDKLVWFLLILIPSGPSAMLLANVAEMVNVDQGSIAGYLTLSYLVSPVIAVICALGLRVVENMSR